MIEQEHRFIKKITKYMRGFIIFGPAKATISGIELHHMLRKRQMRDAKNQPAWKQFYDLEA